MNSLSLLLDNGQFTCNAQLDLLRDRREAPKHTPIPKRTGVMRISLELDSVVGLQVVQAAAYKRFPNGEEYMVAIVHCDGVSERDALLALRREYRRLMQFPRTRYIGG